MSRPDVLIIGAGMAGLTAAHRLVDTCNVIVVDKGRGVGGRLATRRIGDATLDHGAQFITTHTPQFAQELGRLIDAGDVTTWFRGRAGSDGVPDADGHPRYRGVVSMNAIAKSLAVGLDVRTASLVTSLAPDGDRWGVMLEDGAVQTADAVLATAPVPQTLALLANGNVDLATADATALSAVTYDPCIALMATLDGPSGLPFPGAVDPEGEPIDWIADNALKGISAVPAVTIHATATFSRDNWDAPNEVIVPVLLDAAALASPAMPESVQIQRWRFARPSVEHPERFLRVQGHPPFLFAGDAFGGAKVEGAALSGAAAATELLRLLVD